LKRGPLPGVQDHGVGASHGAARHENVAKKKKQGVIYGFESVFLSSLSSFFVVFVEDV